VRAHGSSTRPASSNCFKKENRRVNSILTQDVFFFGLARRRDCTVHELSIAESILKTIKEEQGHHSPAEVVKVGLRLGKIAGVDANALSFSFEALIRGSEFAGVALEIERSPWRHQCPQCHLEFTVVDYKFTCPECGERDTVFLSGDEMEIYYMEVEERETSSDETKGA